jgi:DNA-binding MarR family transcriptional regulator
MMDPNDYNETKIMILKHLSSVEDSDVGDIAKTLGLSRRGCSMGLLRLGHNGLVRRTSDERPISYEITEKGKIRLRYLENLKDNR